MIVTIIQARMGSTRLPGKVLLDLHGKPLLWRVIQRCKRANVDKVVVATSTAKGDDRIEEFCKQNDIDFFRGDENDVLSRFYECAKQFSAKHIVRIWGDCPLIDPKVINTVIEEYFERGADYCSNLHPPSFPRGNDVEVFSFKALEKTWGETSDRFFREYMTDYMFRNPEKFKIENLKYAEDISFLNWTVDYKDDFLFAESVIKYFKEKFFHMEDILELLKNKPRMFMMNKDLPRYEDYKRELKERGASI